MENPFHATGLFLYFQKTSEKQRFSDVLRGYRKRSVAWKLLTILEHGFLERFWSKQYILYLCSSVAINLPYRFPDKVLFFSSLWKRGKRIPIRFLIQLTSFD